jgi:hypothetical protein
VNWLRAKARFNRWEEELRIVKNEMRWTVSWFNFQTKKWTDRAEESEKIGQEGHACYAWKQGEMWRSLASKAEGDFCSIW